MNNENSFICQKCGGACCKSLPGMMFPEDVLALADTTDMAAALAYAFANQFVVDWWEGDVTKPGQLGGVTYFIRPRAKNDDRPVRNSSWGGTCVFLGQNGCVKVYAQRPRVCRELSPRPGGSDKCMPGAGKYEAALAWVPYQKDIVKAFETAEEQL
jgi:Fe-S-cluster containining protein